MDTPTLTAQEAHEFLSNTTVTPHIHPDDQWKWDTAMNMALSALARDIPYRVKRQQWMPVTCKCGYNFSAHHGDGYFTVNHMPELCPSCGTVLDWRDFQ